MESTHCPRCRLEVSEERRKLNPPVCNSCGFVLTDRENNVARQFEEGSLRILLGLSGLIVLAFIQAVSWGTYSAEIVSLQVQNLFGHSPAAKVERLATICMEMAKYDCVEKSYTKAAKMDPSKLTRLAKFQMSRGKFEEALIPLRTALIQDPKNVEVRYYVARSLGEIGKINEAIPHFENVLKSRPGVLQVTVVQNYVRLLKKANKYDLALQVIRSTRNRGSSVANFMDAEYKQLLQRTRKT